MPDAIDPSLNEETTWVTRQEIVAEFEVHENTVSNAAKAGHIPTKGKASFKRYDLEAARRYFEGPKRSAYHGVLTEHLREVAEDEDCNLDELTVMRTENDPFRIGNDEHHKTGRWFRHWLDQLNPPVEGKRRRIHLRGFHYRLVAHAVATKPDGTLYTNTDEDWSWLSNKAARWARWLGYVPFEWIVDEYNDRPIVYDADQTEGPFARINYDGHQFEVPASEEPQPECGDFALPQPYQIILVGEKTSLAEVLRPIAERVHGTMMLFAGNPSISITAELARRIEADGRPAVVLYFADFDPSGWNMPILMSRQFQAWTQLRSSSQEVCVHRVALIREQCVQYELPSTPLKATERRGTKWRAAFGREQTEIDALAALRPEILAEIANEAVAPFFDDTLAERADEAENEWHDAAQEALEAHPEYDNVVEAIDEALDKLRAAVAEYERARAEAFGKLRGIELPPVEPVEPEDNSGDADEPLYDSTEDFAEATRKLMDNKAYEVEE